MRKKLRAVCGVCLAALLPASVLANDTIWFDDVLPPNAVTGSEGGDSWYWTSSNPAPFSGGLAHQSAAVAGLHQHYFSWATGTLAVNAGDVLFVYVYLDPANPPSEVMVQWFDGSWEHRAYWGADLISYGVNGSASRRYMGPLPPAGQWIRLQVPAHLVALENRAISGMAFTLFNGRATWDYTGKSTSIVAESPSDDTMPLTNVVKWVDDSLPQGAVGGGDGGDSWNWIANNPTPQSGSVAHISNLAPGSHQHYFSWATETLAIDVGDILYAYVYLDPANLPSQVMLQWFNGTWEHRAYWGANHLNYGVNDTASRRYMGPLPPAGQWVRLEVLASDVALEGSVLSGMAFTLYGGRATWDNAGKGRRTSVADEISPPPASEYPPAETENTNPPPVTTNPPLTNVLSGASSLVGASSADYLAPEVPPAGTHLLRVLTPTLLELKLIHTKDPDPARVTQWDLVDGNNQFIAPSPGAFAVTANGQSVNVQAVGFRRRPLYAPLAKYDLRIESSIYLQLAAPLSDNQTIEVKNPNGMLWGANMQFISKMDPLRFGPAIHVNHEGYMPDYPKKAMVGYFLGSFGEMTVPASSGFKIVDAITGATVFQGALYQRLDTGWNYTPRPYQKVYEADFTNLKTPGQYRLVVPGLGASVPFYITDGVAMNFARAYALGLYHQRCGTNNTLPYTRHDHDNCHTALVNVPTTATAYPYVWQVINEVSGQTNPDNPPQTAPRLSSPETQLFPFVNQGPINVSGGHHDAGDYSKYLNNSASMVHYLMFAVDSLAGVSALDNLGIPESGDGISDVLQEAKWEADFLAKMQDTDGGFYFLVYPRDRRYESNVTPDKGDPQIVYPKTTSVTAAAVAALAQCASSPAMKQKYPQAAAMYLTKAKLGWQFLQNAIAKHGKNGAYQRITHYGDVFADQDELAWAACEMYLATGDPAIHQLLMSWFDPSSSSTMRWGWWRMSECYGHAIRSYAFAARSGRLAGSQLNTTFLAKCEAQIIACGDDNLKWSNQSAYGTSFPEATKNVQGAGWYFSTDQAYDIAVAHQLSPKLDYLAALVANMNYEGGCNPINVSYVTGLGWKRNRDIVHQYALNDKHALPPSGIPSGNVQWGFANLWWYGNALRNLCYPQDGGANQVPFYDRWGDSWNVATEFVVINSARSLGALAYLAAQTSLKTQAWKSVAGKINAPTNVVPVGQPITFTLSAPGLDLTSARIVWEARDVEPAFGSTFTFVPVNNGVQWIEAEAQLPDGRRVFAEATFTADSPNLVWVEDAVPMGAVTGADGGDSWNWISSNPAPFSGARAHTSANASGSHQHFFYNASATMNVGTGCVLYAYVYLDPASPPSQVMLQWYDGTWEHRAYWGANNLGYGADGTASRRYMGALPASGQWVQLKVPARDIALEGKTVSGMAFTLFNGRATWDAAGMLNPNVSTNSTGAVTNPPPSANPGPTVITVTATEASRTTKTAGSFTLTRTGDLSSAMTVNYTFTGSAVAAVDYEVPANLASSLSGPFPSMTIPAGAASITLPVSPVMTGSIVSAKTLILTLTNDLNYQLGSIPAATVNISDNTVPSTVRLAKSDAYITWPSIVGATYKVAYKSDSVTDWTFISSGVTAKNTTTTWRDSKGGTGKSRVYLVVRIK